MTADDRVRELEAELADARALARQALHGWRECAQLARRLRLERDAAESGDVVGAMAADLERDGILGHSGAVALVKAATSGAA